MRRPQFSLKTLLWLTVVVAAFLSGRASQMKSNMELAFEALDSISPQPDEELEIISWHIEDERWHRCPDCGYVHHRKLQPPSSPAAQ